MLQPATSRFLKDLKKNNNKPWFDAHRDAYTAARTDFDMLVASVLQETSKFDKSIFQLQPKDCVFRINRDVRFSKNKDPYKTNFAMYVSKGGKKALNVAGYYFHFEPGQSFVAGGMWMPMAPELKKIRQEIDYCFDEFKKIVQAKKFKDSFGELDRSEGVVLSRPPKDYDATNPAIEYLKLKSFIAMKKIDDKALAEKDVAKTIAGYFKIMQPLIEFLNNAVAHE